MNEHERTVADEQAKEYAELHKIRNYLMEKMSHWDKNLNDSKEHARQAIHHDAEKQIKEIQGKQRATRFRLHLDTGLIHFSLEREKALYTQLDDLHQNYSITRNTKLQKLKSDMEKDSQELDHVDAKHSTSTDRQRLTHHWLDLQRKLEDQHVDFVYKPQGSSNTQSHLGELHLKTPNQDHEHLQVARLQRQPVPILDPFENQEAMYRSNQVREKTHIRILPLILYGFVCCRWSVGGNQKRGRENEWWSPNTIPRDISARS